MPANTHRPLPCVQSHPLFSDERVWLFVNASQQILTVMRGLNPLKSYAISTAKNGLGCEQDSYKTPFGLHKVEQKIGGECKLGELIKTREPTGCIATISRSQIPTGKDLITTRIIWLKGLESDVNCGDGVDSFNRYIYIHGTHEEGLLGLPVSKGCIRMSNQNVAELYDVVTDKTLVWIGYD